MSSTHSSKPAGSRFGTFAECAIWLVVAAAMWLYSYEFDRELSTYALGPVSWPRAIIALIAITAIGAGISDWRRRQQQAALGDQTGSDVDEVVMDSAAMLRLGAAIVLPLAYVWLLPRAGYFATTPVFLASYMYVLGVNSWRTIAAVTIAAYAVLLLLFSKLLYIPLPTGNWPGFYDFSNWLLVVLR